MTIQTNPVFAQCSPINNITAEYKSDTSITISYSSSTQATYYLEYGSAGFTPGMDSTAGTGGTVVIIPSSPAGYTINGLLPSTFYDCYIRKYCTNGLWSTSSMYRFKTAPDCGNSTSLICGNFLPFQLDAGFGAWRIPSCNSQNFQGDEDVLSFTPTVSGNHVLFATNFAITGYNPYLNFYYKHDSTGCSNTGLLCVGNSQVASGSILQFSFGPLTAGETYYIFADLESYQQASTLSGELRIECPYTAQPLNVTATNITPWSMLISWSNPGNIIEFGPPGFIPGTGQGAGGGTVRNGNSPFLLDSLDGSTVYDIYVRSGWTPMVGPNSQRLQENTVSCPPTEFGTQTLLYDTLGSFISMLFYATGAISYYEDCYYPSGEERRFYFDCPQTGPYNLKLTGSLFLPSNFDLSMKEASSVCQPDLYTHCVPWAFSNGSMRIYSLNLQGGLTYDFLFDVRDVTFPVDEVLYAQILCPNVDTISTFNINPTSIDFSFTCPCPDTVFMEYGPEGFTPGTGYMPGVNGAVMTGVTSPFTLSGLQPYTSYDCYFRTSCGGSFSGNTLVSVATAFDSDSAQVINCGDSFTFDYYRDSSQTGAWKNLAGCTDYSYTFQEHIYKFTPTTDGMHSIFLYDLDETGGYFHYSKLYYKADSLGSSESGWNSCFAYFAHFHPSAFQPVEYQFGPLDSGVTYQILFQGQIVQNLYYHFFMRLDCAGVCPQPILNYVLDVTPTTATVYPLCPTCINYPVIEYGPTGFTPGTGNTAGGGTVVTGLPYPYALTGLSTGVSYDVYLRDSCGAGAGDYSLNSDPQSFLTCSSRPDDVISNHPFNTICQGDSITLYQVGGLLAPGATFEWYEGGCGGIHVGSGDSITVAPSTSTYYYVRAESPCGISSCWYINVQIFLQQPVITGIPAFCQGDSTNLFCNTNWTTFNWSTGDTTSSIYVSTPGTYTLTVTNSMGCITASSIAVVEETYPLPVISGQAVSCSADSVTLDAGSGYYSILWNTGETTQTIQPDTSGVYIVTVSTLAGCSGTDSISITINPSPSATITGPANICLGEIAILEADTGYTCYLWAGGQTTQMISASASGIYVVTICNNFGCTALDSFQLTVNPIPIVNIFATGPVTFCQGDSVLLTAPPGLNSWQWLNHYYMIPGATNNLYWAKSSGRYKCIGANAAGCADTSNIILVSVPCISLDPPEEKFTDNLPSELVINITANPSNGSFLINSNCDSNALMIGSVTDIAGRNIGFKWEQIQTNEYLLNVEVPGLYLANFYCGNNNKTIRLIVLE